MFLSSSATSPIEAKVVPTAVVPPIIAAPVAEIGAVATAAIPPPIVPRVVIEFSRIPSITHPISEAGVV